MRKAVTYSITVLVFIFTAALFPRFWCGRDATGYYDGDIEAIDPLAREVSARAISGISLSDFNTGSKRFNGEWVMVTRQMAVLGLCQIILDHPDKKPEYLPAIERSLQRMGSPEGMIHGTEAWGEEGLSNLEGPNDHGYLGYYNLALSMHRMIAPRSRFAEINDRLTEALIIRLQRSPIMLLQTYPNETYPVETCGVIASIALHGKATGKDYRDLLARFSAVCRSKYIDPSSGLFYQAVDSTTGQPFDKPRASGTALSAYYLSFADQELSKDLYESIRKNCGVSFLGFGLIKEYSPCVPGTKGDIDSGPVVFGISPSATGFILAGARQHRDEDFFIDCYRTIHLGGAPLDRNGARTFVTGGPLANAIMLAMFTAPKITNNPFIGD